MPTVAKINKASSLSSDLCLYKLGEPRFEVLPVPFSYWHPLGFAWGGKKQRSKVTEFDTEAKVLIIAGIVSELFGSTVLFHCWGNGLLSSGAHLTWY